MKFDIELVSYNKNEHTLIVTPEIGGKPFRNIFCAIKDESGNRIFDSQYRGEAVQLRNYIANVLFDNPSAVKVCSGCGVAEGQVCKSTCHKAAQRVVDEARREVAEGPTTEEQQSRADAEDHLPEIRKPEADPETGNGDALYTYEPPLPAHPPTAPTADCGLCQATGRLLVVDETTTQPVYRMMWCPCVRRRGPSSSPSCSSDVDEGAPIDGTGPAQEDVRDERGSSSEASDKVQLEYRWTTCGMNHGPVWSNKRECSCGRLGKYYNTMCQSCSNPVVPTQAGLCPVCDSVLLSVPEAT